VQLTFQGGFMNWLSDRAWAALVAAILVTLAAAKVLAAQQTFNVLVSFDGNNGGAPYAGLVQGLDGDLYGTTSLGLRYGTFFKLTTTGSLTGGRFDFTDGAVPESDLIQDLDGNFYGTTVNGGASDFCPLPVLGCGTIFEVRPAGGLTSLYSFCTRGDCADGIHPVAPLVRAIDGSLYGTTSAGGGNCLGDLRIENGCGTIFKITPTGTLTTLYTFCSKTGCADGANPSAGLVQASDGNFYGTTYHGGAGANCASFGGCGTAFKFTPAGTLTTLYSFCTESNCADGVNPSSALVQASDGNFYGTTYYGGVCYPYCGGTVFKMTAAGALTTLYSFCSRARCMDGETPYASLIQAIDGNFYGTTEQGGNDYSAGTVFRITPAGKLTTLHTFCSQNPPSCSDGLYPVASLTQDTNGNLYGTTESEGTGGDGVVFSLGVGLGPFVKTLPTSGNIGAPVKILGTDLTGATSVTFNGVSATFNVVAQSEIQTTVPSGATTGPVQVVTPGGTLTSNVPFRVIQ
jgi:uncharacterized repeat protein (TIGR03803 family)